MEIGDHEYRVWLRRPLGGEEQGAFAAAPILALRLRNAAVSDAISFARRATDLRQQQRRNQSAYSLMAYPS